MKERYVREILSGFPYPILVYFTKLRTDECLDPGPLRLKYILATSESISRYFAMAALSEFRHVAENGNLEPPSSLTADFVKQFRRPSWGIWVHILREILKCLHRAEVDLVMPELMGFFFEKKLTETEAASALQELLKIRNQLSHDKIKAMNMADFKTLCDQTMELLEEVLESMEFLLDYELTFISKIEVNKRRKVPPTYLHKISKLVGNSEAFQGDRLHMDELIDSSSILLRSLESGQHLNLDPFMVYESTAGKAPDIFFFNGLKKPGVAEYSACNHGGVFISEESERADVIAEELQELEALFTRSAAGELVNG